MLVAMTTMVISEGDISNVLPVVAMIAMIVGAVMYAMRNLPWLWHHGEDLLFGRYVRPVQANITQINMMRVHIPFTFKLPETTLNQEAVRCKLSSEVEYRVHAYWGVSIRELHLFLWSPWPALRQAIDDNTALENCYQQAGIQIRDTSHIERTLRIKLPSDHIDLGTPPRLRYPLVIFLIRDTSEAIQPDETVALINVVHIRDDVCTLPTSILAQYIKQANGQLSCLKQLYIATGTPANYDPGLDFSEGADQLCVICHYYPLSRALLPCRHTCICASCFIRLETCPLCRSPIQSFFIIRPEDYLPETDKPPTKSEPITQWLHNRFTDFLGLHR